VNCVHTADDDATQLDSCVTSVSAVCVGLYTSHLIASLSHYVPVYLPHAEQKGAWGHDPKIWWVAPSAFVAPLNYFAPQLNASMMTFLNSRYSQASYSLFTMLIKLCEL